MNIPPSSQDALHVPTPKLRGYVAALFEAWLPAAQRESGKADKQAELVMADEFTGEPGISAVRYESDFAPWKPRCDARWYCFDVCHMKLIMRLQVHETEL